MYKIFSDTQSVEKSNSDLIEKLEEGKRKLEKKLDIQSHESGNHFETLMKNYGEMKVLLDQNYEKENNMNTTMVENFETLNKNDGNVLMFQCLIDTHYAHIFSTLYVHVSLSFFSIFHLLD